MDLLHEGIRGCIKLTERDDPPRCDYRRTMCIPDPLEARLDLFRAHREVLPPPVLFHNVTCAGNVVASRA